MSAGETRYVLFHKSVQLPHLPSSLGFRAADAEGIDGAFAVYARHIDDHFVPRIRFEKKRYIAVKGDFPFFDTVFHNIFKARTRKAARFFLYADFRFQKRKKRCVLVHKSADRVDIDIRKAEIHRHGLIFAVGIPSLCIRYARLKNEVSVPRRIDKIRSARRKFFSAA